jgi:hypothetical protein
MANEFVLGALGVYVKYESLSALDAVFDASCREHPADVQITAETYRTVFGRGIGRILSYMQSRESRCARPLGPTKPDSGVAIGTFGELVDVAADPGPDLAQCYRVTADELTFIVRCAADEPRLSRFAPASGLPGKPLRHPCGLPAWQPLGQPRVGASSSGR